MSNPGAGETTPAVMLSPNARNRAPVNRGGPCTLTMKEQVAVWPRESCAWQLTVEGPTGNALPGCGVQLRLIGAVPPELRGCSNGTLVAFPSTDCAEAFAGHVTVKACGCGVGCVGESQALKPATKTMNTK